MRFCLLPLLFFYIASPCQDDGSYREDERVHEGDDQRVRSIYRHRGPYTHGRGMTANDDFLHEVEVWPQEVGRDILPEIIACEAESQPHNDDTEVVNREPTEREAQAKRQ